MPHSLLLPTLRPTTAADKLPFTIGAVSCYWFGTFGVGLVVSAIIILLTHGSRAELTTTFMPISLWMGMIVGIAGGQLVRAYPVPDSQPAVRS